MTYREVARSSRRETASMMACDRGGNRTRTLSDRVEMYGSASKGGFGMEENEQNDGRGECRERRKRTPRMCWTMEPAQGTARVGRRVENV